MKRSIFLIFIAAVLFSCATRVTGQQAEAGAEDWTDVHGAGAQRSDPKSGDPQDYAGGSGPQGDARRINNMVRAVRLFSSSDNDYPVVGTNQLTRYDDSSAVTDRTVFYGQDADYLNLPPSYTDNGDGTVTDNNTGLMWQQDPGKKTGFDQAFKTAEATALAGYDDWRVPSISELYSLIVFSGKDVDPSAESADTPFIDTDFFVFSYGDISSGERIIDSQYMSSTEYVSTTMHGNRTVFGVNFADGRIKGYPEVDPASGGQKQFYLLLVRGNSEYGKNNFIDNGDGTVSDLAAGLMWMKADSGKSMKWGDALGYCENLDYAGYSDWRLPDAKELQSIVDYSRSPDTSGSPALDPVFEASAIVNEAGQDDYAFYWSSTTHVNNAAENEGSSAVYVSFGRAMGNLAKLEVPGRGGMEQGPSGQNRMPPPGAQGGMMPPPRR